MAPILAIRIVGGFIAGLVAAGRMAAKRRDAAAAERLRTAPVGDLAAEVAKAVTMAGWGRLEPGAALQAATAQSDRELLEGLDALWSALVAEDEASGRSGRDSNYFDFYDFGLARTSEALRERVAR